MINEGMKIKGELQVIKTSPDGTQEEYNFKNLIVESGIHFILRSMYVDQTNSNYRPEPIQAMALGTDGTAQVSGNTALGTEIARVSLGTKSVSEVNNTIEFQATFPPGTGTGAITEAGIFNNLTLSGAPEDIMLCRTAFPAINKLAEDQITIAWVITLTLA